MNSAVARAARDPYRWQNLRKRHRPLRANPALRQRDAARRLQVSEGELVAAYAGAHATRLRAASGRDFAALLEDVSALGRVVAVTRNDAAVHERVGVYEKLSLDGDVGMALGAEIDLRIFYARWAAGFAVRDPGPDGARLSLQFYDAHGDAIHKIRLRADSDRVAFEALVARWRADDQRPSIAAAPFVPRVPQAAERPDAEVDVDGLRRAWSEMTEVHQFFGLLKRFGVTRPQALRLGGSDRAFPVAPSAPRTLLQAVAEVAVPVVVFVGNPGMIQIHTGPLQKIAAVDGWLNVLDGDFNLHLREDLVERAWVVRKPTSDGILTSVELFDAHGETIAILFGARKRGGGEPESAQWREVVERLPRCDGGR